MKKEEKGCNYRGGVQSCPVGGQCLRQEVIYEAEVAAQQQENKSYIGSTATTFKERFGNQKSDCKLEHRTIWLCVGTERQEFSSNSKLQNQGVCTSI